MTSSAGLNSFGIREVAKGVNGNFIGEMISVRIVNACIVILLVGLVAFFILRNHDIAMVVFVTACSVLPSAFHLDWYFQGKEEMQVVGFARLLSAAAYLLMLVVFVHSPEQLLWVAAASVVGEGVTAFVLQRAYRRGGGAVRYHFSFSDWKKVMLKAFPLGAGSLFGQFSISLPPLVLGIFLTASDVGIYSAGNKLVFFLLMLDRALATILLPASSRLQTLGVERLVSLLEISLKWILSTTLPLAVGGTLLAHSITLAVFGASFQETAVVFQILIWYVVLTMIHTVYTSGVIALGGEKNYGRVMFFSAMVYTLTIIVGTVQFGVWGAAVAVVFSEALTVLMMRQQLHKHLTVRFPRRTISIFASAALMGVIVWMLSSVHFTISIVLGCLVYLAALVLTRGITGDDITYLVERL